MSALDAITTTWAQIICCHAACGISWAMPKHWVEDRRRDHASFCCPNGHRQSYPSESDAECERRKKLEALDALARERARHDQTKAALEHAERSRRAVRGHLSRTKARVAAGVCPCCRRSFPDLRAHMSTKHPGYAERADG